MSYQVEGTDLTKLVELLEWLLDQEVSEVLQALEQLVLIGEWLLDEEMSEVVLQALEQLVLIGEWLLEEEVSEVVLQALEQLVLNRWVAAGQGGVKGGAAGPRAAGPHR